MSKSLLMRAIGIFASVLALSLPVAAPADAVVNYCGDGRLLTIDGFKIVGGSISGVAPKVTIYNTSQFPIGLASDGTNILWMANSNLYMGSCDGTMPETLLTKPAGFDITFDVEYDPINDQYLAGGTYNGHTSFFSVNADGSDPQVVWSHPTDNMGVEGIDIAGTKIFFCSSWGRLYSADLALDSITNPNLIYPSAGDCDGVVADPETGLLYWAKYASVEIIKASMDGTATPEVLYDISDGMGGSPSGMDINLSTNPHTIYWAPNGEVQGGDVDGGGLRTIYSPLGNPNGILVFPGPDPDWGGGGGGGGASTFAVDFDSNGGSSVDAIDWTEGDDPIQLPTPTRENYTFDGWYTDAEFSTAADNPFTPSDDVTLYAKWTLVALSQPAPPASVTPRDGALTVTVTPNTDGYPPTSYRVYSVEDPEKFCEVSANADPLECTIDGLKVGQKYSLSVVAIDGVNDRVSDPSVPTEKILASRPPLLPIPRPATPSLPNITAVGSDSVTVKVTPGTSVGSMPTVKYRVVAIEDQSKSCEVLATANPLQCTITGLASGDVYSFVVIAVSADGTESYSSARSRFVIPRGTVVKGQLIKTRVVLFFAAGSHALDKNSRARLIAAVKSVSGHATKAVVKGYVQAAGSRSNDYSLANWRVAATKWKLEKLGITDFFQTTVAGRWPVSGPTGRRVVVILGYRA